MAVAMRDRVAGARRRAGAGAVTTSASASGSPRATRRSGRIGFEGRYDYAAIGSVTNLAPRLCARRPQGQILVTQRVHAAAAGRRRLRPRRRARPAGLQPPGAALQRPGLDAARIDVMTADTARRRHARRSRRGRALRALRPPAGAACPRVWERCGSTSPASRSSSSRRSRLDPVTSAAGRWCRPTRSASSSSCCCCASRGCG